jgi:hypothetical protein
MMTEEEKGMSAKDWIRIMVSISAVSALLLGGCNQKSEERTAEKVTEKMLKATTGKEVDVKIQGKNIQIEGRETRVEISETTVWPSDMFQDVPPLTEGKIEHVTKSQEEGTRTFNIFFVDLQGDVLKNYAAALKEKGWEAQLMEMGKGGMISAQKNQLGLHFSVNQEDRKGTLAVFAAQ